MPHARTHTLPSWLILGLGAAFSAALLSGCASTPPGHRAPVEDRTPPPTKAVKTPVAEPEGNFYVVKKGDTLSRIAANHKIAVKDLVAWNELSDPNKVETDQRLRLVPPGATALPPAPAKPAPTPPVATTAPVAPTATVEVKPLGPAPGQPGKPAPATASTPAPQPAPATPSVAPGNLKTEPLAGKVPWSEQALAKARGSDVPPPVAQPGAAPAANGKPEPKAEPKPEAKAEVKPAAPSWAWPAPGEVVRGFDGNSSKGIDIAGKVGDPVLAAGAGKVVYAGSGLRGYGKLVIIKHNPQFLTAYGDNGQILVKEGHTVAQGQKIAEMGKGEGGAGRLHFEVRQQGKPVDPQKFLPAR